MIRSEENVYPRRLRFFLHFELVSNFARSIYSFQFATCNESFNESSTYFNERRACNQTLSRHMVIYLIFARWRGSPFTRISFRANLHAIRATFSFSVILETDQDNTTHQRAVEIYIYFFSSNCLEQSVLVQRPTTFILRSLVYSRKVSGIEFVAVSRTEPGVESTSNDSLALLPLVAH